MKRRLRIALRLHKSTTWNTHANVTQRKDFADEMFTSGGLSQDFAGLAQNRVTAKNQV